MKERYFLRFVEEIKSQELAKKIANWEYPSPYDIYNMNDDKETIREILNEDYYAYSYNDILIGYFCYGKPARVPNDDPNLYEDEKYLDIGVGMNPKLCGEGRGYIFFNKAVDTAYDIYEKEKYRLTVAEFNQRAIKVYMKYGFRKESEFIKKKDDKRTKFLIMTYN